MTSHNWRAKASRDSGRRLVTRISSRSKSESSMRDIGERGPSRTDMTEHPGVGAGQVPGADRGHRARYGPR